MITHHGTYIDGFAAPQDHDYPDMWAAKLVLEMEPKWFRDFWFCDISPRGLDKLRDLRSQHISKTRRITVLEGDFNNKVHDVLNSGQITERKATFALLDQRTFECEWKTVESLSKHKSQNKIEIFYFFATGWIDRSIAAVRKPETAEIVKRWWGNDSWRDLRGMDSTARAQLVAQRFKDELKYRSALPYAIHSHRRSGRVMYHMIHATDHIEAPKLMIRAYRRISGRSELEPSLVQSNFDDIW